jgi:hypothetical protein
MYDLISAQVTFYIVPFVREHVINTSITIIIALATTGLIFSSAAVFIPNTQSAFGSDKSEKQAADGNKKQSSSDDNNKQSSSSSSSDENKKKQVQDEEKQVQDDVVQIQYDVTKLQADEKQIKVDLSPSQMLVEGGSGERLQNPSIQQSLEASKQQQQQPNVGKLATPPPILAQYDAGKAKLQADQNKLTSDVTKLREDQGTFLMMHCEDPRVCDFLPGGKRYEEVVKQRAQAPQR